MSPWTPKTPSIEEKSINCKWKASCFLKTLLRKRDKLHNGRSSLQNTYLKKDWYLKSQKLTVQNSKTVKNGQESREDIAPRRIYRQETHMEVSMSAVDRAVRIRATLRHHYTSPWSKVNKTSWQYQGKWLSKLCYTQAAELCSVVKRKH